MFWRIACFLALRSVSDHDSALQVREVLSFVYNFMKRKSSQLSVCWFLLTSANLDESCIIILACAKAVVAKPPLNEAGD